jgi:large subunit ribosomal protein L9
MAKTEVILTHNILGLGAESDQVKVAAGYARNYLIPQGKAIPLTGANKRRIEALQKRRGEREAHEYNSMSDLAKSVAKLTATLKVKTGDDGKLFGSVTAAMISDELKSHFDIHLDRKKIHLEHPIRTLGQHEVQLHLHGEINATLKVVVESLTKLSDAVVQAPATPAEGRDAGRDADSDRRGRKGSRGPARGEAPDRSRTNEAKE